VLDISCDAHDGGEHKRLNGRGAFCRPGVVWKEAVRTIFTLQGKLGISPDRQQRGIGCILMVMKGTLDRKESHRTMALRAFAQVGDEASRRNIPCARTRFWRRLVMLIAVLALVGAAIVLQGWYQQQTGMVVGRPLASRETHVHTVVFSSRPGVVYLGTHFGLFTSTDSGRTWPQQKGALSPMMITAVAVSPTNPDLLAVVSAPNGSSGGRLGIWVSANGGSDFQSTLPASLPAAAYPYTIQSAPGAGGHFYAFFTYSGWFETRDLGRHWFSITSGSLATVQVSSLLVDPTNPNHLLMGGDTGLFETENDGQTWQQITQVQGSVNSLVATQGISRQGRTFLCATDQGLYRSVSETGHIAWSQLRFSTTLDFTRLALSDNGSALYALSGSDLWFSPDLGTTWVHRWHFTRGDLTALAMNPDNAQELLAGFFWPGLVLISTNAGSTFHTLTD